MAQRIVILADPGIDGAFAIALALADPDLELLGLGANAGNVPAEKATENVQIVVEQLDPARWPRLGAALPSEYDVDGQNLHGRGGLGGVEFPVAKLHHPLPADKLVVDLVRQYPREITIVVLGPLTGLAAALDRDPELPRLVDRVICLGGSWHEPGNASAVAEFHFYCDPLAARKVLRSGAALTLIPLDVSRKVLFSPTDLLELPAPESRTCQFLRQIVPCGIRSTSNLYGIEGFHLKDVLGIAAVSLRGALSTRPMHVDVETRGELTRGMSVVDARPQTRAPSNVELAVGVDVAAVRDYIGRTLRRTE
ncbi:MAG: nucleoside hydrolase [Planctomycetia bacterium]|nr:nucleoside hydrolase [Planctomycetia bacterium]